MIELISRNAIKNKFSKIASEIARIQHSFYDVNMLEEYKEQGEEQEYWNMYDFMDANMLENDSLNKVVGHDYKDLKTFVPLITKDLQNLFTALDAEEFVLISFIRLDFFGSIDTDYLPLKNAHARLMQLVASRTYKEGLIFKKEDLEKILEVFFWLTRYDPNVPEYIFIFDSSERFQFNFCKYGNIHLAEFGEEWMDQKLLNTYGFHLITEAEEDCFSEDGSIDGRSLAL